jgi:hypothetical protein
MRMDAVCRHNKVPVAFGDKYAVAGKFDLNDEDT